MSNVKHVYGYPFLTEPELWTGGVADETLHTVRARLPVYMGENGKTIVGWGFPRWLTEGKYRLVLDLLFHCPLKGIEADDGSTLAPSLLSYSIKFAPDPRVVGKHINRLWLDEDRDMSYNALYGGMASSWRNQPPTIESFVLTQQIDCTCGVASTASPLGHSDWCSAYGPSFEYGKDK